MAWYPKAVRKPLTNKAQRSMRPVRINLHTAVSNSSSMYSFFRSQGVYSHFYIRKDGVVEQYQDTKYRAACDLDGNADTISIESWDGYKSGAPGYWRHDSDVPPWNEAQLKGLRELIAWILATHPSIPRKLATDNRASGTTSHGLSYHRLGVPGYAKYARGTGLHYSLSRGKVCPGSRRIAQVPSLLKVVHVAATTAAPSAATAPAVARDIATMAAEVRAGKHGTGHETRRASLGIDAATYELVRAEVNRVLAGGAPTPAPTIDTRTDIERLLDNMDETQLRKIIRDESAAVIRDLVPGIVYIKAAELAHGREKRDGDLHYLKVAEALHDILPTQVAETAGETIARAKAELAANEG